MSTLAENLISGPVITAGCGTRPRDMDGNAARLLASNRRAGPLAGQFRELTLRPKWCWARLADQKSYGVFTMIDTPVDDVTSPPDDPTSKALEGALAGVQGVVSK